MIDFGVLGWDQIKLSDKDIEIYLQNILGLLNPKGLYVLKVDNSSIQREERAVEEISQSSMENLNIIKSPMVGTVYLSPSPEEPTFIQVGKKIKKGDTILIIEAMKTMNQIPSTIEGTVKEILVNNESPVEFDTPLVIIEP